MRTITLQNVMDALSRMDAPLFTGELNLNIVGVRSADRDADTFNDVIALLYQKNNQWRIDYFPATTDPGGYYRTHSINTKGTAILKPGHYRSCWQIGLHRGKYTALVQRGPMTVYRDNNKDEHLDAVNEETGLFGINLHHASRHGFSMDVGRWSAGCQVIASAADFNWLMETVIASAKKYGSRFSYTLLTEEMLHG